MIMGNKSFFKVFTYAFTDDPLAKRDKRRDQGGAGYADPSGMIDVRAMANGTLGGGGSVRLRDTNDFVDLSTVTNRIHRYKEYDRLRGMPEIEMAMTVFADEACLSGDTLIATPAYDGGYKTLQWLAENKANDRFLVYCFDFNKGDYTLGWAYAPRLVKEEETVKVVMDDGSSFIATKDHRILGIDGAWIRAGQLAKGSKLMPFYHIPAKTELNKQKHHQFPRIWTHTKGWIHERQFVDEWKTGKDDSSMEEVNRMCMMVTEGLGVRKIHAISGRDYKTIQAMVERAGFSNSELKWLAKKPKERVVVGVFPHEKTKVYDLSVDKYENFCTNWGVAHNCQRDEDGRVFHVICNDEDIKEELEYLLFHRKMLNLDQKKVWNRAKNLFINGDEFWEVVINPENPKDGIINIVPLPADTMYRIETTKGRLIEFQQSKEGPDYNSLSRVEVTQATDADLQQSTAIRFAPEQIVHIRIGDDRKTFYPYGVSLIEAARGPAHQLRLMEDSMVVYRLSRSPERRVFYIDVQQMAHYRAESFIERMKDQFKKKKVPRSVGLEGASAVDEKWHAPAVDEDYWIPIRPNSNTRVETLPGACLALDTEIPLLDGRNLKLKDIIKEFEEGKQLWTYSCNPKTGETAPGLISWAGITRKNTEVVKVTFDNGKSIICTPDHKFPVQGVGKVQAKDLQPGYSMFPFHTRMENIQPNRKTTYRQVYDSLTRKWEFVHRMVMRKLIDTEFYKSLVYFEEYKDLKKNVIHHIDYNRLNNDPKNLTWMNWDDHEKLHRDNQHITNSNISKALKSYHENMPQEDKAKRNKILSKKGSIGNKVTLEKLQDPAFNLDFRKKQIDGWAKAKQDRSEIHEARGNKISKRNQEFWANPDNKKKAFDKQTIVYPKDLFDLFVECIESDFSLDMTLDLINSNQDIITNLLAANQHLVRNVRLHEGLTEDHVVKMLKANGFDKLKDLRQSLGTLESSKQKMNLGRPKKEFPKPIMDEFMRLLNQGMCADSIIDSIDNNKELKAIRPEPFTRNVMNKMLKSYGYDGLKHAQREKTHYNHKVVSVEYMPNYQDTGTLTIDQNHIVHNYHTFAINDICYTFNSNLGEIDDTVYFRNKLFISMNFPKNYFNNEDSQTTRISLSAQDVKFARMIERLQSHLEDAMWDICDRHLKLRGFPEEAYEDLEIKFTPPSDWRELTRAEVTSARIQNAGSLKGAQIMADFDILTKWMKYSEDEAKTMLARMKIQKLEDLKLQIIAQNPQLLGVGMPGPEEGQIGAEAGPDQQMPGGMPGGDSMGGMGAPGMPPIGGPAGAPPGGGMGAPPMGGMSMAAEVPPMDGQPGAVPLPMPSAEDVKKYNLDINDFAAEQDEEEVDFSET